MSRSARSDDRPGRGFSRLEWTIVLTGLLGGLLLGAILLGRGASADNAVAIPRAALERPTATASAEVDALKRRVAELEQMRLARRLAELEADTDEPVETVEPPRVSDPVHAPTPQAAHSVPAASSGRDTSSPGPTTLAYWNALNDIVAREAAMRAAPSSVTAASAGGFVEARLQAGRYASGAIRDLDSTGADADVVALSKDLIAWYEEEITLNERAKSLLGSSDIASRKGAAGNSWRTGEEQHRRKCEAINRRGAEVRTRLSRKYGLAFPPLN